MAGSNLSAESMIRPVLPGLQGSGRLRRSLPAGFEVAKTGWRMGGGHGRIVFSDPRRSAARRNIDLDRHSVATRSAQHVYAGRLADPRRDTADGRPRVYDALYSGARGQDRAGTRAGPATGDGGRAPGPRARRP